MYDKNNVFAKILRGELPSRKIFENEHALSFYNIAPKVRVHALVIPKGEFTCLSDFCKNASAEQQSEFWNAVFKTAEHLGIENEYRTSSNSGIYQTVPHFHIHLLSDDKYKNEDA